MITLPTEYSSHVNRACTDGEVGYAIKIAYNTGSTTLFTSVQLGPEQSSVTWGVTKYATVAGVSEIVSQINPFDCSYAVSNVSFTLTDGIIGDSLGQNRTLADVLDFPTRNYVNRAVLIYKFVKTSDLVAIADAFLVFTGVVIDIKYDVENALYKFDCVQSGELLHKDLPQTVVTKEAYPNAAPEAIGARLPILYGGFYTLNTSGGTGRYDAANGNWNLAPSVCTDAADGEFVFADHAIDSFDSGYVGYAFPELRSYGLAVKSDNGTAPSVATTDPATMTLPKPAGFQFLETDSVVVIPRAKGAKSDVSDISNVVDSTYGTVTTVGDAGAVKYLTTRIADNASGGAFPLTAVDADVTLAVYVNAYTGGGAGYYLTVWNPYNSTEELSSLLTTTGYKTLPFGVTTTLDRTDRDGGAIADDAQWTWDELSRYEFGVKTSAGATADVDFVCLLLGNIVISGTQSVIERVPVIDFEGDERRPVVIGEARRVVAQQKVSGQSQYYAANIGGREFGSWIDDGGRANSFNAGSAVGLSAFQIESILRDELGVATGAIDTASIDAITEADLPAYVFSLTQPVYSRSLIRELSYFSRMVTYQTADGVWRVFFVPDTPSTSDADLDFHSLRFTGFYWSSQDWLLNDVTMNYAVDYSTGAYQRTSNAADATSKGDGATGLNRTAQLIADCPYIRYNSASGATNYADAWTDFMVAQWKDQHLMIDFELLDLSLEGLQEGDVVTFVNVPGASNTAGVYSLNPYNMGAGSADDCMSSFTSPRSKYFLITSCRRGLDKVSYTAFNLHIL